MADYRRYDAAPRHLERDLSDDRAYGMYRTDDRGYHDRYRHEGVVHNPEAWGDQHLPTQANGDGPAAWGPRERGGYWRQYEAARGQFVGRGPKGYQRSDERIRDEVCDRMTEDPMLDASEIEVEVRQGEVTLCGSVMSRDQKRRAEDVAERVGGVKDVTNQLRVTRDGNGHNWAADSLRASGTGTTSSQQVTEASGKGTPSKSTSGTSA
jgi:hypothetical protein